jgi:hypothetical protein
MSNVPEGAQLSDDGHWWWDGQQWQAVTQDGDSSSGAASGEGAATGEGAVNGEVPDERTAARIAQGLPASLHDVTGEQRDQYLAEPTVTIEAVDHDEVEVLAMQDAGHEDGEATA